MIRRLIEESADVLSADRGCFPSRQKAALNLARTITPDVRGFPPSSPTKSGGFTKGEPPGGRPVEALVLMRFCRSVSDRNHAPMTARETWRNAVKLRHLQWSFGGGRS